MTTMNLRMEQETKDLIFEYARLQGTSASSFLITAAIEKIEDSVDLLDAKKSLAEYEKNPVSYSMAEIQRKYGL
jgi:uncharacterized protein (DUF1778 family)